MHENEDGAVLVLSIIIILVLTVLTTALVSSINNNISFTKRHENEIKALYAAEAGIEQAINDIRIDPSDSKTDGFKFVKITDDYKFKYRINDVIDKDGKFDIISNAEIGGFEKKLKVRVSVDVDNNSKAFNNALTSGGSMALNLQSGVIDGDIYARGAIARYYQYIDKLNINGNIEAGGAIDWPNFDSSVSGDILPNQGLISMDDVIPDFSNYFGNEKNEDLGEVNNPDYDGKVIELAGDKEYNNFNNNGSGIIVIDGDLSIKNNIMANNDNEDEYLIILVDGDIETSMHIEGNVFIYATGKITINNNPGGSSNGGGKPGKFNMNGSIMAKKEIDITEIRNGGFNLNYDNKFLEVFKEIGYGVPQLENSNSDKSSDSKIVSVKIESWKEFNEI